MLTLQLSKVTAKIGLRRALYVWFFFGTPGNGFDDLFLIAEQDANRFYINEDSTGKLTLVLKNAPLEFGGPDTPNFGVEVSIDYYYVFS